ncbi:hypothetical protein J3R83DRAFT_13063 [Lanmaoa asiatica]|nr:hypothetical protein J3R83DRAFT_13063 [Lanmaoa asiatica]
MIDLILLTISIRSLRPTPCKSESKPFHHFDLALFPCDLRRIPPFKSRPPGLLPHPFSFPLRHVLTMSTSTTSVPPCILRARDARSLDGYYLADPSVLQRVRWERQGRKSYVFEQVPAQHPATPPALASLSVIAHISDDLFWLTSDANWRRPTAITPSLAEAKATCVGTCPTRHTLLRDDFQSALDQVHTLQDMVATGNTCQGFTQTGTSRLKFRHVLFEPTDDNDLEGTLPLSQWPVHSPTAKEALDLMGTAYRAIPLPAYDIDDQLIPPAQYRQRLSGALAEITFHLSHINFDDKDSFTGDIYSVRVLQAPPSASSAPKRKLPQTFLAPPA